MSINSSTEPVDILFDGYICPKVNFSAFDSYCQFNVYNEDGVHIFAQQISATRNYTYSHYGNYVPVKAGWKFKFVNGQGSNVFYYVFTHV